MNWEYISKLQRGCAFVPCYLKGAGKVTKIFYEDGNWEHMGFSIGKVINDYFNINMRSVQNMKRYCGKIIGKKSITPLYLNKDCILMPIKTIKPCVRGDRCIGYVNIEFINIVDFSEHIVELRSGSIIDFMDCNETIKKRIAECAIIKQSIEAELINYSKGMII